MLLNKATARGEEYVFARTVACRGKGILVTRGGHKGCETLL